MIGMDRELRGLLVKASQVGRKALLALAAFAAMAGAAAASDFSEPWKREDRAIVVDAYENNPIDWSALATDGRIVGFINKGSDGLPPPYFCAGDDTEKRLCRALWLRYSVARELYHTRRTVAKALGLTWGVYHLGRPGNPVEQANHLIDFAQPEADDLVAIDIEEHDPEKWMSLEDAEEFVRQIHRRLGRFPLLYTNGATAQHIADNRDRYRLLSRLPLWYARYKPEIGLHFPKGNWQSYALWQFSAQANCNAKACPYRVPGTKFDIDVNVAAMSADELRAAWPFGGLIDGGADTIVSVPVPVARSEALAGRTAVAWVPVDRNLVADLAAAYGLAGDRGARPMQAGGHAPSEAARLLARAKERGFMSAYAAGSPRPPLLDTMTTAATRASAGLPVFLGHPAIGPR